jgi:hypothetical protein
MTDEEKKVVETGKQVDDMTQDYLATIKELKENSVDRQEYEKLKAENKQILDLYVDGKGDDKQEEAEVVPTIDELREDLFGPKSEKKEISNLEYAQKALLLRKQLMDKGEPDPFLPIGKQITPDDADIAAANRVATVLQECIDYAEGDSAVFTNELQRRTIDVKVR